MNAGAMEFVPGKGFTPVAKTATPVAPPPAPASTSTSTSSSAAPPTFVITANAVNSKANDQFLAISKKVKKVINDGAYSLKEEGKFDLSFKGRKNVVFPHLEAVVKVSLHSYDKN